MEALKHLDIQIKQDIKVIKRMIGDRQREICIREYSKCNDGGVRDAQKNDENLKTLYKILDLYNTLNAMNSVH